MLGRDEITRRYDGAQKRPPLSLVLPPAIRQGTRRGTGIVGWVTCGIKDYGLTAYGKMNADKHHESPSHSEDLRLHHKVADSSSIT
jgi:hypothetical protein